METGLNRLPYRAAAKPNETKDKRSSSSVGQRLRQHSADESAAGNFDLGAAPIREGCLLERSNFAGNLPVADSW